MGVWPRWYPTVVPGVALLRVEHQKTVAAGWWRAGVSTTWVSLRGRRGVESTGAVLLVVQTRCWVLKDRALPFLVADGLLAHIGACGGGCGQG